MLIHHDPLLSRDVAKWLTVRGEPRRLLIASGLDHQDTNDPRVVPLDLSSWVEGG